MMLSVSTGGIALVITNDRVSSYPSLAVKPDWLFTGYTDGGTK